MLLCQEAVLEAVQKDGPVLAFGCDLPAFSSSQHWRTLPTRYFHAGLRKQDGPVQGRGSEVMADIRSMSTALLPST